VINPVPVIVSLEKSSTPFLPPTPVDFKAACVNLQTQQMSNALQDSLTQPSGTASMQQLGKLNPALNKVEKHKQ
jgi:hypothetical protein